MRALALLAALCLGLFVPFSAHAWGPDGHAIVADIAEANLTPTAKSRISEILHGERMRDVASWANQIRPARPETSRWHYVNLAPGAQHYRAERDCVDIQGRGDCVVAAIQRSIAGLKGAGTAQEEALKFLIHFVGDVHQPFHAVAEAIGGNQIRVTFLGNPSNLHKVWDSDLILSAGLPPGEYAQQLRTQSNSGAPDLAFDNTAVIRWALQSRAIGLRAMVANNSDLGTAYSDTFRPLMDRQLYKAGVRLAAILNAAFR